MGPSPPRVDEVERRTGPGPGVGVGPRPLCVLRLGPRRTGDDPGQGGAALLWRLARRESGVLTGDSRAGPSPPPRKCSGLDSRSHEGLIVFRVEQRVYLRSVEGLKGIAHV